MKTNKNKINHYQNSMTIHFVDGLCGSGKTHGMGCYIQQSLLLKKFIITTPSKALAEQIETQLIELGIANVHKVHSEDEQLISVPPRIMDAIQKINILGKGVIICTQQIFPRIGFFENKSEWGLIVDEIPKVDYFSDPSLPYNHTLFSQYINTGEPVGMGLLEVFSNGRTLGANQDDINAFIRPVIENLISGHYKSYSDTQNWEKLVIRQHISDDDTYATQFGNEHNKLYFLQMLQPTIFEGFQQIIMMGANFEQSLLYKYWSEYCQVHFKPFMPIMQHLRYSEYSCGEWLTIRYLQEADWSKYAANKILEGKSMLTHHSETVRAFMGENTFLYMTNHSDNTAFERGIKAAVISHGMNQYQHLHHIYFSPALNNQPKHNAMLEDLGIDKVFIKRAMSHEVAHQAIMRTALRNPASHEPVTAVVIDKATADSIARLFPNCQIGPIAGCLKKTDPMSNALKQQKSRLDKLINTYELNALVRHLPINATDLPEISKNKILSPNSISIENSDKMDQKFTDLSVGISYMSDIYQKSVLKEGENPMAFVRLMKSIYTNNVIRHKDESFLFNGVTYKTEHSRALSNVDYASIVILDFDDGDLSKDAFYKIFTQHRNYRHSFLMCNSFSRCAEKPNNFRVIFFIQQVVSDAIYRDVQAYIHRILAKHGYISCWKHQREAHLKKDPNAKFSGVDLSKSHTASFFYIPCQVEGREDWAFFEKGNVKNKAELQRYAIDVEKVLQYQPEPTELVPVITNNTYLTNSNVVISSDCIDKEAIKSHIKEGDFKHLGHHNIYGSMARALCDTGFTLDEFIELTPYISKEKTVDKARTMWNSWKGYYAITTGTLFFHLGLRRTD